MNKDNVKYRVGLAKFAMKEIGFFKECSKIEIGRTFFRDIMSQVEEDFKDSNFALITGYDKETCDEYMYDDNRVSKDEAMKLFKDWDNIIDEVERQYEEFLLL